MQRIARNFGATDRDIELLKTASNDLTTDPTLSFRKSKNSRFELNFSDMKINRLEAQPFVLSAQEDFLRHDSSVVREFDEIDDKFQSNRAFQALLMFKAFIISHIKTKNRIGLDYKANKMVSTVFNLRTITTAKLIGEPALEGVHADGVDHTMTTLLGMDNFTKESAITFIHNNLEINGTKWNKTNPDYLIGQACHRNFLDTILIADHEMKHSLSPLHAENIKNHSKRDMIIVFSRHPATKEHISHPYDSFIQHPKIPLSLDLHRLY